jgi:putative integral membrane protein (TIGR02587 family)
MATQSAGSGCTQALDSARHAPATRSDWADAWAQEVRTFARAFAGAFLFGIPLLFTMEMWWLGETSWTGGLFAVLIVMLLANFLFAVAVGFRRETSLYSNIEQAVDAVAVGIVAATVVLVVFNELDLEQSLQTMVGKVVFQALPLSLGASLANAVFNRESDREGDASNDDSGGLALGVCKSLVRDLGATAIGAIFIAAAVAPTEEIPMLAGRIGYLSQLALIGLTLVIGYIIVFAGEIGRKSRQGRPHLFQHPITETCLSYLVALLVAFGALLLTQQISPSDPPAYALTQTLVLGLPAMVGGAAGRLAI